MYYSNLCSLSCMSVVHMLLKFLSAKLLICFQTASTIVHARCVICWTELRLVVVW